MEEISTQVSFLHILGSLHQILDLLVLNNNSKPIPVFGDFVFILILFDFSFVLWSSNKIWTLHEFRARISVRVDVLL